MPIHNLTALFPFSLAGILYPAAGLIILYLLTRAILRIFRTPAANIKARVWQFAVGWISAAGCFLFLFVITFYCNYYRTPFAEQIGLSASPASVSDLYRLCTDLIADANTYRTETQEDSARSFTLSGSFEDTGREAAQAMSALAETYPVLAGAYHSPKPVPFSAALSYTGITGLFSPFTFEANVNTDVPAYSIPATMCHELSHLRGFMNEEEANLIAYLACRDSSSADFRYSGAMLALSYSLSALYEASPSLYWQAIEALSEPVRRDLNLNNQYWAAREGTLQEAASAINDTYLKASNQPDGVKSYGGIVDLLLALQNLEKPQP